MSTEDSIEHLKRLLVKRARLTEAIEDCCAQIGHALRAEPIDVVGPIYDDIRDTQPGQRNRAASSLIADNTSFTPAELGRWKALAYGQAEPEPTVGRRVTGTFPVGGRKQPYWGEQPDGIPRDGIHTVYALFNHDDVCIYVGTSRKVRTRLRTHWREKQQHRPARWELIECASKEHAYAVERNTIARYNPTLNVAGRSA